MTLPNIFAPGVDELNEVAPAQVIGVSLDAAGGAATMLTVPEGQCFLIERIVGQGIAHGQIHDPSPVLVTPGVAGELRDGIAILDAAATTQWELLWRPFLRQWTSFFNATPRWQSAEPQSLVNWKLRFPICVPPNWTITSAQSALGNNWAVYGRLVSRDTARNLGYSPNPSVTDADRTCGVDSMVTFSTTQILVPARAGYSIQILDIWMRLQPVQATAPTSNTLTVEQGDGRAIFVIANNNITDMREVNFAPGIYLKPGQSLNAKSATALNGSIVISWRYVIEAEVPSDHWWACVEPGLPTPTVGGISGAEHVRATSHEVTCFYPRRNTTKTSPTTGFQHLLRGYLIAMQKDAQGTTVDTDVTDAMVTVISTHSAAPTITVSDGNFIYTTGVPVTPMFAGVGHDQNFALAVGGLNIPGKKDNGSFWIDSIGTAMAADTTPLSTTLNVDEFWVTLWGKTIPNRFSDPANRGSV